MHRAVWSGTLQSAVFVTLKGDRPAEEKGTGYFLQPRAETAGGKIFG